jgi:hypothetical protein
MSESLGYQPKRPHANVSLSDETRKTMEELAELENRNELFTGNSAEINQKSSALIERSFSLLTADLRRFLGAEDAVSGKGGPELDTVSGLLTKVNLYAEIVSWTDEQGWTYWGAYDYLTDECRYIGKSRGGRIER